MNRMCWNDGSRQRILELSADVDLASAAAGSVAPAHSFASPPILFFHPATNDALYSRRERELAWLDACAKDPRIRIATVTGVGGLGKTSLVGHWIEQARGWQHRAFRGVFFYSFYSDRDPEHFFAAFLQFVCEREKIAAFPADRPLHHLAAAAVRKWCYLVVLDGLEVLQHDESDPHYGWINDGALNEFVARAGAEGPSLLVLTSRFPFPEVTREHPEAARACELPLLTDDEGSDLLAHCGLDGGREKLGGYSHQFGGHPLALRLFAGACLAQPFDEPETVSRHLLAAGGEAGEEDAHRRQFRKLLLWLQKKLPAEKRRLLQLVALFREPVPTATLAALATGLDAMKADFGDCDPAHLRFLLDALVRDHLLQREEAPGSDTARWAAHPIVREVFRAEALKAGAAISIQFTKIISGNDEWDQPNAVSELSFILEAIEVLLDAHDFETADQLYRGRLASGYVFADMPAVHEGVRCVRSFLEPADRREAMKDALGGGRMAIYLDWSAFLSMRLGEMREVEEKLTEAIRLHRTDVDWRNISFAITHLVEAQTVGGKLTVAILTASEGLFYSGYAEAGVSIHRATQLVEGDLLARPREVPPRDANRGCDLYARRAHACTLGGYLSSAARDFTAADTIERAEHRDNEALHSLRGTFWGWHRLSLADFEGARALTTANRSIAIQKKWNSTKSQCELILANLDVLMGDSNSADRRISAAVKVFREARQGQDLPNALLAQARLRGSIEDCEEALRLAARSGFALKQCDALNLRARLRREAGQPADAAKDARDALEIAERCGYYWGRHEALRQLRDAAQALGHRADAQHWDEAEKALAAKMQPEIEEALRINREHDAAMEKLYGKKQS